MLSCFIASPNCRTRQHNDKSNVLYSLVLYVTYINNIHFSPKWTCCKYLYIITPGIVKFGAKSETEIIMISTNFSFVSYDNDEIIFNVSLLGLDFCLEYITVFRVLNYILCLIAVVIDRCLLTHIFDCFCNVKLI